MDGNSNFVFSARRPAVARVLEDPYWWLLSLGLGTFFLFLPVLQFDFLMYDDPNYVTSNKYVNSGLSVRNVIWAVTTLHGDISYWHPLTWLSHQLDTHLFGLNPGAHHLTNVIFHALTAVLLASFLYSSTRRLGLSSLVAALFAVHPLHVESVAWISERKDILSGFFLFLTLNVYLRYVRSPSLRLYLLVSVCLAAALMSKPSAVVFPIILLLVDVWPLRRLTYPSAVGSYCHCLRPFLEKIPWLIMAIGVGAAAYIAQHDLGAITSTEVLNRSARVDNAAISYVLYLLKMIFPFALSVIYVHPPFWPFLKVIAALCFVVVITLFSFRLRQRSPYFFVGWFWYLIVLAPMSGLVQAGAQSMADRYTYLSAVGVFIAAAWCIADLMERFRSQRFGLVLASCVIIALGVRTRNQLYHWDNSIALFSHATTVTENNWVAYHNFALALANAGRLDQAERALLNAKQIVPRNPVVNLSLGRLALDMGSFDRACQSFVEVLAVDRRNIEAHRRLALIYAAARERHLRNGDLALSHANMALDISGFDDPESLEVLAVAHAERGDFGFATNLLTQAIGLSRIRGIPGTNLLVQMNLFTSGRPYRLSASKDNEVQ